MAVVPIVVTSEAGLYFRSVISRFSSFYTSLCEQYPIVRLIVSFALLLFAVELASKCFKASFDFFSKE